MILAVHFCKTTIPKPQYSLFTKQALLVALYGVDDFMNGYSMCQIRSDGDPA